MMLLSSSRPRIRVRVGTLAIRGGPAPALRRPSAAIRSGSQLGPKQEDPFALRSLLRVSGRKRRGSLRRDKRGRVASHPLLVSAAVASLKTTAGHRTVCRDGEKTAHCLGRWSSVIAGQVRRPVAAANLENRVSGLVGVTASIQMRWHALCGSQRSYLTRRSHTHEGGPR